MLNEIPLSIDDLLLDPNNPRFIDVLSEHTHVPDEGLVAHKSRHYVVLVAAMKPNKTQNDDEQFDVTNIKRPL